MRCSEYMEARSRSFERRSTTSCSRRSCRSSRAAESSNRLTQLLDVCVAGETTASPSTAASLSDASAVLGDEVAPAAKTFGARYPRSARKLRRMVERLDQTGYVTFLE